MTKRHNLHNSPIESHERVVGGHQTARCAVLTLPSPLCEARAPSGFSQYLPPRKKRTCIFKKTCLHDDGAMYDARPLRKGEILDLEPVHVATNHVNKPFRSHTILPVCSVDIPIGFGDFIFALNESRVKIKIFNRISLLLF